MPFEEWIYGLRQRMWSLCASMATGSFGLRLQRSARTPVIFTKDEVEGLMRTDGTPLIAGDTGNKHTVKIGDVQRDPDTQAPAASAHSSQSGRDSFRVPRHVSWRHEACTVPEAEDG